MLVLALVVVVGDVVIVVVVAAATTADGAVGVFGAVVVLLQLFLLLWLLLLLLPLLQQRWQTQETRQSEPGCPMRFRRKMPARSSVQPPCNFCVSSFACVFKVARNV